MWWWDFAIMPIAGWISNSLVGGINWVLDVGGPVDAGPVAGAAGSAQHSARYICQQIDPLRVSL